MALTHTPVAPPAFRSVVGRTSGFRAGNTTGRRFQASALELAGVLPVDGLAIFAGCSRPRDFTCIDRCYIPLATGLAEAFNRRWTHCLGGARRVLRAWRSQEIGCRGLDLSADYAGSG